jgi:nucleotide-binding universal stress UspA family protein
MSIEKLLFVTRFQDLSFDDLKPLLELRKAGLNHIVFLNVIESEKVRMQRGVGFKKSEAVRLKEMANVRFIDWAETLFEQGLEVGVYIVVGNVVQQVVKSAKNEDVDLIVMGHQPKTRLQELYTGVDISEILERTRTPILIHKEPPASLQTAMHPFQRPLLATAWSQASLHAIEFLKPIGPVIEEIHILHVADKDTLNSDSAMSVQQTRKENRKKLDTVCAQFTSIGVSARGHVHIGDPVKEIEQAAQEQRASMVALGMSRRAGWQERWMGSIPRTLMDRLSIPVLMVPTDEKAESLSIRKDNVPHVG